MALYKILKKRKIDMVSIGFLSPKKKSWVSTQSTKHKHGLFNETEALEMTHKFEQENPEYYFFRTIA